MKRVLFVDDEPNVLSGLRRMLRYFRDQWEMEFAEGGTKALGVLQHWPADVIVTDMRMPGMDGAELLGEVRRRWGGMVRIVLSGQCDRQSVIRALGPIHQFLTKPCEVERLQSTVARACRLRDRLPDETDRQLVSRVTVLGSRPSLYQAFASELDARGASIARLGHSAARDPAMALRVLQLVNSGFFGTPQNTSRPEHAANLLGLDLLRPLVHDARAIAPLDPPDVLRDALETLFDHSQAVAKLARRIALDVTGDESLAAEAYLGGLLHDVGLLLLAQESPERAEGLLAASWLRGEPILRIERQQYTATHAELGAYLAGLWGLSEVVVDAVARHHEPPTGESPRFDAAAAVWLANALDDQQRFGWTEQETPLDDECVRRLGWADRLDAWRAVCCHEIAEGTVR